MSSYKTVVREIGSVTGMSRTVDSFASEGGLGGTRDDTLLSKTGNASERDAMLGAGGGAAEISYLDGLDTRFASEGGLGGTRDPEIARTGNFAVDHYLATGSRDVVSKFASEGGLGGTRDPEAVAQAEAAASELSPDELEAELAVIEASYQASVSTLEDLPPDLLKSLPAETILRLAYSPEDMAALDLNAEHDAIGSKANLLSVNNPDQELASYLLKSGQFTDVILSGHGNEDGIFVTDPEGRAQLLTSDELASMMCDTGVEEILLNVCEGGASLDDALNDVGISTFGHERDIYDREAIEDAEVFAASGTLAAISTEDDIYGTSAVYNDVTGDKAAFEEQVEASPRMERHHGRHHGDPGKMSRESGKKGKSKKKGKSRKKGKKGRKG